MLELLTFDDFVATLAQLRQALASHALAAGVHTEAVVQKGWLTNLVASVSHSARALASLKPRESLLLSGEACSCRSAADGALRGARDGS